MNTKRTGRILLTLAVVWGICGWNQAAQSKNILFIGNSHTYVNNMPGMLVQIAFSTMTDGAYVTSATVGGYTLTQHLNDPATLAAISSGYGYYHKPWDYVVLQEHSAYPAYAEVDTYYRDQFQAAATGLYDKIKMSNPNSKVILFETAAWHQSYFDTYEDDTYMGSSAIDMQARVRKWCNDTAYSYIPAHSTSANKNDMMIARIGDAWERNYSEPNPIMLHIDAPGDYWHPGLSGTYLGALMMYSTIYNKLPQGITYTAGMDLTTAKQLQQIATKTVVPEPGALTPLIGGLGCMLLSHCRRSRRR